MLIRLMLRLHLFVTNLFAYLDKPRWVLGYRRQGCCTHQESLRCNALCAALG
jgi:hypothetical protein